ncbi:MAG: MSMEG_0572 family nitrogen starvation response protein [Desulfovibrionaceae bacterium]|nr:MSMEG_0572 family nitrogen starvation response protein [Desulfovibrionaceae bacterium]
MAMVEIPQIEDGQSIVNTAPETKMFQDYKARPGDAALITMHTMPFEGSVGLINQLTATRLTRKGYDVALLLYGPAVLMAAATRGFPTVGAEGFPGNLSYNKQLKVLMKEGCKIYVCRFAMAALYGMRESDLIPGVQPIHPLDVLDITIEYQRKGALMLSTWTV